MVPLILVAAAAAAQAHWVPLNSTHAKQAQGQVATPPATPVAQPAPVMQVAPAVAVTPTGALQVAPPVTGNATLQIGTEVPLRLEEELTTKGKQLRVGQRFHLTTSEPVIVNGVTVIPVGTPAEGEITDVRNKGMWGKSGHLAARLLYLTVNGRQIRLSGTFDDKGVAGGWGAAAVSAFVFLPAGFFMTGTSAKIPAGATVKGFIAEDVPLALPAVAQGPMVVAAPSAPMQVQPAVSGQQH